MFDSSVLRYRNGGFRFIKYENVVETLNGEKYDHNRQIQIGNNNNNNNNNNKDEDINAIDKKSEKILKYKELTIEIESALGLATKLIPVITGATGSTSKSFTEYLSNMPEKQDIT